MVPGRIITQIPTELRAKLALVEAFAQTFEKEIKALETEIEYRKVIKGLLREIYNCYDDKAVKKFFAVEVKKKNWEIFNYLFIRKAIDMALDLGGNEREVCSKLL